MSNHRFVTSLGQPYFAFVADGIGDLSTLPSHGLFSVRLNMRVDALPTQSASADELHPVFSFAHDIGTQPPICEVGVTPSGRLKVLGKSGATWSSRTGLFTGSGVWQEVQVDYTSGTGVFEVTIDGYSEAGTMAGTTPGDLLPAAGHDTRIMLFNGRDALARTRVSVREVLAAFLGSGLSILLWSFGERSGDSLTPTLTLAGGIDMPTPAARAQWYESLFYHPWGVVPTDSPNGAYSWGLETDFTAIARPVTAYTQVAE